MRADRAIAILRELKAQALLPAVRRSGAEHETWRSSVLAVMSHSLPMTSGTTTQFSAVRYHVGVYFGGPGEAERDRRYFASQVDHAVGFIDAAIFELELLTDEVESGAFDSELWDHVKHSVEEERWEQVASATATFVEDKVRRWADNPTDDRGGRLYGQTLFAHAFADGGPLVLGSQANERTGWRNLAIGFTAALGNVDRHNIQDRDDLRLYALGVLGLGSLLLTQIRHEHAALARQ